MHQQNRGNGERTQAVEFRNIAADQVLSFDDRETLS
jgi:hypothetical protein